MIRFEVIHSQWAAEDDVYQGGVHELGGGECACGAKHGKPTARFLRLLAGAEAAGSVTVLQASREHRARLRGHVQSQKDGEKAYAQAVKSGDWQEGNLAQFELDVAAGTRSRDL